MSLNAFLYSHGNLKAESLVENNSCVGGILFPVTIIMLCQHMLESYLKKVERPGKNCVGPMGP